MKKGFFKLAVLSALAISVSSFAFSSSELCEGFVPQNDMKIPVGTIRHVRGIKGGLTEADFNSVIDRAIRLYGPVIQGLGGTLVVNRKWTDNTVNASAQRTGTQYIVNMYGGLARHGAITVEGFALVICHEIGHHLGGAPKGKDWWGSLSWATNEGGADYFSTLKCLRNYFAEDDNETIIAGAQIDAFARARCEAQFTNRQDQLLCMRSSMSGTSVSYLFMDLNKDKTQPRFDTPDPKVVTAMDDAHPATQCRMDTYFAGASCAVAATVGQSDTDYHVGACSAPTDTIGNRPLCWFKP